MTSPSLSIVKLTRNNVDTIVIVQLNWNKVDTIGAWIVAESVMRTTIGRLLALLTDKFERLIWKATCVVFTCWRTQATRAQLCFGKHLQNTWWGDICANSACWPCNIADLACWLENLRRYERLASLQTCPPYLGLNFMEKSNFGRKP